MIPKLAQESSLRFNRYNLLIIISAVIGVFILLTNVSEDATILGRYSLRYLILVLGYISVMALGTFLVSLPLQSLPAWFWLIFACVGLIAVAWLPLLSERPLLNIALKLSFGSIIFALVFRANPYLREFKGVAITGVLLLLSLSLLTLESYPYLQTIDEGWNANLGWTFVNEGVLYTRINQGIYGIPELNVPIANVLPGYWMQLVGVGLLQVRLLVWFGGLIFISLMYISALRLYRSQTVALVAALAALSSVVVLFNSHLFRLDIWLGVAGLAAFYLYLRAEQRPRLAFGSGLLLAGGIEIHQNALMLCIAAGVFIVLTIAVRSIQQRRFMIEVRELWFVLGGGIGALLFLVLHVLPNPQEFVRQLGNSLEIRSESVNTQSNIFGPFTYLTYMFSQLLQNSPFEVIVLIPTVIFGLLTPKTRCLTLFLLLILVIYGFFGSPLIVNYLINFWWLVLLIFAGLMADWIQQKRVIVLVLCFAFAAPTLVSMAQLAREARNEHLLQQAKQIAATFAPDERVVALHYFFFAMPENPNLIAPFMPEYAAIAGKQIPADELWSSLAPDVFVVSPVVAEPTDTSARDYREMLGFTEMGRYNNAGCCVYIYRRDQSAPSN